MPWRRKHPSVLAWRIHGRRSLLGYNLWGCKESDRTERLSTQMYPHFLRPFLTQVLTERWVEFPVLYEVLYLNQDDGYTGEQIDLIQNLCTRLYMRLNKVVKQLECLHSDWFWCCTWVWEEGINFCPWNLEKSHSDAGHVLAPSCTTVSPESLPPSPRLSPPPTSLVSVHAQLVSCLTKRVWVHASFFWEPKYKPLCKPVLNSFFQREFKKYRECQIKWNNFFQL